MWILTGDIGGTNTRLALVRIDNDRFEIDKNANFASTSHASLSEIIDHYQARNPDMKPAAAAFGVAGPVKDGVSRITNLPWVIAQQELAVRLGLEHVAVLNDLEALAWGIEALAPEHLFSLQAGDAEAGANRAVIAAGTGLGQAGLVCESGAYRPFATEGGHSDFAASNELEWQLLQFLRARFGAHVSWERVVSGPGLVTLFEFLLQQRGATAPPWLADPQKDSAAMITEQALAEQDELCVECLDWFVRLYAAEAGNLALKMKCSGGLYLGGGIAPKILPALQRGAFIQAFLDKGRMRPLLEAMPVQVILHPQVGLLGLARCAGRDAST